MLFTLFPTIPGSADALLAKVVKTSGNHAGGGDVYGNAWINAPRPRTAACRVSISLVCSGVGVLVPDKPVLDLLGRGESRSIFANFLFNISTTFVRKATDEQRIMPDSVVDAPRRTSSWVSSSMLATQSKRACCS